MATYTLTNNDDRGVRAKQLVASAVDTVTFQALGAEVEILTDGIAALYVTADGSTPTVAGVNTYVLPAGGVSSLRIPVAPGQASVKLVSAGAPTYSVTRLP